MQRSKLTKDDRLTALKASIRNTKILTMSVVEQQRVDPSKQHVQQSQDKETTIKFTESHLTDSEANVSNSELLVLAIAENNPEKFQSAVSFIGKERLLAYRFEHNMNVLNLAIDMESVEVCQEIKNVFADDHKLMQ